MFSCALIILFVCVMTNMDWVGFFFPLHLTLQLLNPPQPLLTGCFSIGLLVHAVISDLTCLVQLKQTQVCFAAWFGLLGLMWKLSIKPGCRANSWSELKGKCVVSVSSTETPLAFHNKEYYVFVRDTETSFHTHALHRLELPFTRVYIIISHI